MQKSKKYEAAILDFFKNHIDSYKKSHTSVQPELVFDKEQQRYLLVLIGWDGPRFVYAPLFHFDIINGKVWLQQNSTDILVADELFRRGIPKEDIIIAFKPAYAREYSGFGIA